MHSEGHAGLSLLVLSLLMLVFGWVNLDSIVICLLIITFSSWPDIDLRWRGVEHRGPTHTLLFGVISGIAFAALFGYAGWSWQIGFIAAFGGTALHLLGDILTRQPIKPFWPFSQYEIALYLFKSRSQAANKGFATLGAFAFLAIALKYAGLF